MEVGSRRSELRSRRSEVRSPRGTGQRSAADRCRGAAQLSMNPTRTDPNSGIDAAATRAEADIPCPFCACLCDDLRADVRGGRVIDLAGACQLARAWFLGERESERPACRID